MPAEPESVRRRTGGRSARVREAVLRAALDVLTHDGPAAVSLSEIARRAGVHATSLQRRWGSTDAVLLDAMLSRSQESVPVPDTGTVRGDLVAFATSLALYLASERGAALTRTMAAVGDDAGLAESRNRFWRARYEIVCVVIDRAVDRAELPTGTDAGLALELLIAPLHFRHLLTREAIDEHFIEQTVEVLIDGLAARRGA